MKLRYPEHSGTVGRCDHHLIPRKAFTTRTLFTLISAVLIASISVPASAQSTLDHPVGERTEYLLVSGLLSNQDLVPRAVFSEMVVVPNAAWIRLYFGDTNLESGSYILLTALSDGEVQELDAATLAMWGNTSAYFNGDAVILELYAGPQTQENRVSLDHLVVEYGNADNALLGSCGICGPDNRFPSNDDWSGRILNVGCSGSIWNTDSCVVSAGHCTSADNVIQFRVPPSNPDCSLNHPPVADQFPITGHQFDDNGVGDDWAVMTTGTNNLGQKAFQRYGALRPIAGAPANVGDSVNVWGFGIDSECVRSQTQQDSAGGPITLRTSTYYEYNVDITFGNSGSGLIKNGEIVGIVTHCSVNCPDFATRVDNPDFANARDNLCPACPSANPNLIYVDGSYTGSENGSQTCPFNTVAEGVNAVNAGGQVVIQAGTYSEAPLTINKALTPTASGGSVTIR